MLDGQAATRTLFLAIFLIALMVFSLAAYLRGPAEIIGDSFAYVASAQRLITTGTYDMGRVPSLERVEGPTGWVVPGYSLFLVPFFLLSGVTGDFDANVRAALPGIIATQLILASMSVAIIAYTANELHGKRGALIAGTIGIAYLPLAFNATYIGTETLSFFLTSSILMCSVFLVRSEAGGVARRWAVALGVSGGALILVRPAILPWLLVPLFLFTVLNHGKWRKAVSIFSLCLLMIALVMSPWIIRNALVFNEFIPLTTSRGSTHALLSTVLDEPVTTEDQALMDVAWEQGEDGYRTLAVKRLRERWEKSPIDFVLWKARTVGSAAWRYPDTAFQAWAWKNEELASADEAEKNMYHYVELSRIKNPHDSFRYAVRLWSVHFHHLLIIVATLGFILNAKRAESWLLLSLPVFFLAVHSYLVVEPRYLYYNVPSMIILATLAACCFLQMLQGRTSDIENN